MSNQKTLNTRIQNKTDTTENWGKASFIPYKGELIIYQDYDADGKPLTPKYKNGDGKTKVNDLPFSTNIEAGIGDETVQQIPRADKVTIAEGETTPHFGFTGPDEANMAGRIEYGAVGNNSASFNGRSAALNKHAFAINNSTIAKGEESFAQGYETIAEGNSSVATGSRTWAKGLASHTEGEQTYTEGDGSHAEGIGNIAHGLASHAEGFMTEANGDYSHASGLGTKANGGAQTVVGMYNKDDPNAKFIVGVGYSDNLQNAFTAGNDGTNDYITIGETKLTESKLQDLMNSSAGGGLNRIIVDALPSPEEADSNTIYMLPGSQKIAHTNSYPGHLDGNVGGSLSGFGENPNIDCLFYPIVPGQTYTITSVPDQLYDYAWIVDSSEGSYSNGWIITELYGPGTFTAPENGVGLWVNVAKGTTPKLLTKKIEGSDLYEEYMLINGAFELIGNTSVDLSDYVRKSELVNYVHKNELKNYMTREEVQAYINEVILGGEW